MLISSLLGRSAPLGFKCVSEHSTYVLKRFSQFRRLSSFKFSTLNVSASRLPPFISSHSDIHRRNVFSKGHFKIIQSRYFSSQPKPKPSTLGLADKVLKTSEESKKQEEESKQDQEKQVRAVRYTLWVLGGIFLGSGVYIFLEYGGPQLDQSGRPMRDEFSDLPYFQQYSRRAVAELRGMVSMVKSSSRDKLLPDPVKEPYYQPPYTLLVELTGVLVHPDWTYKTGWRFKKRPGVDYFLHQLANSYFEIVIYTCEQGFTAFPIANALDTQGAVRYTLFRDSTKYENGIHAKDLDKINRDLTKVIAVDWNEKAVHEHRNNAIVLPRWRGNDDDRTLFDLAALLQTIGTSGIEDVRAVLEYYSKFDDPIAEFRKKQQELAQKERDMNTDKPVGPAFNPAAGWIGSLFRKN